MLWTVAPDYAVMLVLFAGLQAFLARYQRHHARSVLLPGQNYQLSRSCAPFSFYLVEYLLDCSNSVCMLPCVAGLLLPLPPALNQGLDHSRLIQRRRKHTLAAVFPLPSASLLKVSFYSRECNNSAQALGSCCVAENSFQCYTGRALGKNPMEPVWD